MNDLEEQLKLQAFLDGELLPDEAKQVAESLARDASAQALLTELKQTKAALASNELPRTLDELREFYWSKISRQIEREAAASEAGSRREQAPSWWRWFAPLAGTAALAGVLAMILRLDSRSPSASLKEAEVIEAQHEDSSIISFRSESEGISVIWVATR